VYLGLPQITSCVDLLDWFPKSATGQGWMKHRPARAKIIPVLLDINGDSPFTQPPMKVVEV